MRKVAIKELQTLSRKEKITLVQELWDDIASGKDINDIPLSHRRELERTLKNISLGKTAFHEWKDVRKKYFYRG
jgi:putative addiction module component (TIGR02574 family)